MLHMWDNKQDLALHIPDEFISDINNYNNLHCNTLIQSITSVIQNTIRFERGKQKRKRERGREDEQQINIYHHGSINNSK